jgi:RND family efflux transporter MFP subunit
MPDIAIDPAAARRRRVNRQAAAGIILGVLIALLIWALRPASTAPAVRVSDLWVATVQQGPLSIVVSAAGTFTPMQQRWVTATAPGTVETVKVQAGDAVKPDTVLAVLTNPSLKSALVQAEANLASARASRASLHAQLTGQLINLQASLASARVQATTAALKERAERAIVDSHAISELEYATTQLQAQQNAQLAELAEQQVPAFRESMAAQDKAAASQVAALQAVLESQEQAVRALSVRAGLEGVVQEVSAHAGETLTLGSNLARVASLRMLKVTLQVPASEASEVAVGQSVTLMLASDTQNQMAGRIMRVSPAVDNGTVQVDVMPEGSLAADVRPNLAVTAEIHVAAIAGAVYVQRPAYTGPNSRATLFRLTDDGQAAVATSVRFGAASDRYIQIASGLNPGDRVIASDTSSFGTAKRVTLR